MRLLAAALLAAVAAANSASATASMTATMTASMTATSSVTPSASRTPFATATATGSAVPFGYVNVQVQLTGGNLSDVLTVTTFNNVLYAVALAGNVDAGRVSVYQVTESVTGWVWVPFGRRLAAPASLPPGPPLPAGVAPVWVFWTTIDLTYTVGGEWYPPSTSAVFANLAAASANSGSVVFQASWGLLLTQWAQTIGVPYETALAGFNVNGQAPVPPGPGSSAASWRLGLAYGLAIGLGLLAGIIAAIVWYVRFGRKRAPTKTATVYGSGGAAAAAAADTTPAAAAYAQGGATMAVRGGGGAPAVV